MGINLINGVEVATFDYLIISGTLTYNTFNSSAGYGDVDVFPVGARMVFQQDDAPTGWQKVTTSAYADAAAIATDTTVAQAGTLSAKSHSHTSNHIHSANHSHVISGTGPYFTHTHYTISNPTVNVENDEGGANIARYMPFPQQLLANASETGSVNTSSTTINTGSSSDSSGTLNIKYFECIVAVKNQPAAGTGPLVIEGTGPLDFETENENYSINTFNVGDVLTTGFVTIIEPTTRMIFVQDAAPTGWSKDTSAAMNLSMMVFSTGTTSVPGTGTVITSLSGHSHTYSHDHGISSHSHTSSWTHTHNVSTAYEYFAWNAPVVTDNNYKSYGVITPTPFQDELVNLTVSSTSLTTGSLAPSIGLSPIKYHNVIVAEKD